MDSNTALTTTVQVTTPNKAIIAVAGYGTRRLPVAKAVDKCMMPLLNRPVIDYVVQDVVRAGVTEIYFIVSGDARQLRDYYSRNIELEAYLHDKGKDEMIPGIMPPKGVHFHYVEQDYDDGRYGTAIPAWLAGQFIQPEEYFYLIMGDQTFWRHDGESEATRLMNAVAQDTDACGGVMVVGISEQDVERYGVVKMDGQGYYQEIVEKPSRAQAPSLLNNASFFLLPGSVVQYVDDLVAHHTHGEYQITDVLNAFARDGNNLVVYETTAAYLDCGTVESWVQSNAYLLEHEGSR